MAKEKDLSLYQVMQLEKMAESVKEDIMNSWTEMQERMERIRDEMPEDDGVPDDEDETEFDELESVLFAKRRRISKKTTLAWVPASTQGIDLD